MSRPTTSGEPPTTSPQSAISQLPRPQFPPQSYPVDANSSREDVTRRFSAGTASQNITTRPYEQRNSPPTTQSTPVRGLGVQSILNPPAESSVVTAPESVSQSRLPPPAGSPRGRKRPDPASPTRISAYPASLPGPRRVLTPKSPGSRAASFGAQRLPSIQAAAGISPHLPGSEPRIYTAEPGSADIPTLPPLSAAHRAFAPISSLDASKPTSTPSHAGLPPQPHDATYSRPSPNPSVRTSPQSHYRPPPNQHAPQYRSQTSHSGFRNEPGSRPSADTYQSGPASYQMTLETESGPMVVPVELDLLQASKVADEKRKRNAGASARFRARRKEKEKEASHTISSLQQDMRELRAERDFYREERNFIRDFAARHVQLPPRPPSPISRTQMTMPESPGYDEEGGRPRSDSAPAAQRRRTGDYRPAFSPPQAEAAQGYSAGYPPPHGIPLPPPGGPGPYASPRSLPPAPSGPPGNGPRSHSSYDPFRRDPFDRAWDAGR